MAERMQQEEEAGQQGGDPGWSHGILLDARTRRVRCKWCNKELSGGVYRLKKHIAGIAGDVARCEAVPLELKNEMRAYMMGKKAQKDISAQQEVDLQDEITGRQRRRDYNLPINRPINLDDDDDSEDQDDDDDEDDPNDSDPDFSRAVRASLRTNTEDDNRRRGIGSSRRSLPRSDSRRSLPRSTSVRRATSVLGCGGRLTDVHDPTRASQGPMDQYLYSSRSSKQPSIKKALKGVKATATAAKGALKGIVKWFLHSGVPAHAASSPYFQGMIDAIAEAGPGLKAPTPRYIYDVGLEQEYNELKAWVDGFKHIWKERGCTIMCDGWTGTTRKSMINFLVYCSEGTIFLKSVDASNQIKNTDYLFRLMDAVVEEIGEENIVQVVTDNEASYKAAGRLLMEKRTHLYWVPCAAHSIDLMMEDIGRDPHVANIIDSAQMITAFIYGHNRILNMMREYTDGRDLLRAGPTRFASSFISLESLIKYKHQLAQLVHSEEFLAHVRKLKPDGQNVAQQVQQLIGDARFWDKISYYLKVIEPLVQVLRMVDGDDKNDMGYLYEAMDKAKEKLKEKNAKAYRKWWAIIDKRWEMTLHHDLHAAGYFFNPRFQYSESVHNDGEVLRGTMNVINRLSRTSDERVYALSEMDRYKLKLGIYGDYDIREAVNRATPAEWWIQINYKQAGTNPLAYVAVRVLSQTTSSSQCERNWSTFSLIHTKIRNRLGVSRLEKLVYCHYNMRLKVKQIQARQHIERRRFMEFAGRTVEEPVHQMDVDELLDEEHPLHAWVETRGNRDVPEFNPQDRSWAEGELDDVIPRDPEFQTGGEAPSSLPERHRLSATLPETPRLALPELRRATSQVDPKRTKDKGKGTMTSLLKRSSSKKKQKSVGKSSQRVEYDEEQPEGHRAGVGLTGETPTETPPLPPNLARLYEGEKKKYKRKRKLMKKGRPVGSDDSTQGPDDDDDDGDAATGAGVSGGYGLGSILSGYEDYSIPPSQGEGQEEGQEEGQGQQGGYEGQQRQAEYDWGYGSSYTPIFHPPTLPYSDISSTTEGHSGHPSIGYGIFIPPAQSEQSSSQQAHTPRGIQRGFHDFADSLFGYGYAQSDYGPPFLHHELDDEG